MKKIKIALIGLLAISLAACTAPTLDINGTTYHDYGLVNQSDANFKIQYEPNWWNICMGVLFFEMIIPPIYVFGFHMMEPVGQK
jgi:hypothetical protein